MSFLAVRRGIEPLSQDRQSSMIATTPANQIRIIVCSAIYLTYGVEGRSRKSPVFGPGMKAKPFVITISIFTICYPMSRVDYIHHSP